MEAADGVATDSLEELALSLKQSIDEETYNHDSMSRPPQFFLSSRRGICCCSRRGQGGAIEVLAELILADVTSRIHISSTRLFKLE